MPGSTEIIRHRADVRSVYVDADGRRTGATARLAVDTVDVDHPQPAVRRRWRGDRQAAHLANTAQSRPFRITNVESKGNRNRRIRFALEPG